jgi:hypothetical protein
MTRGQCEVSNAARIDLTSRYSPSLIVLQMRKSAAEFAPAISAGDALTFTDTEHLVREWALAEVSDSASRTQAKLGPQRQSDPTRPAGMSILIRFRSGTRRHAILEFKLACMSAKAIGGPGGGLAYRQPGTSSTRIVSSSGRSKPKCCATNERRALRSTK